ncbi:hypothetical protein [Persephonella sp. KM09-Lau-8]|uniref:hypothetical protein n=1 Tax=Persephonella sp. KM09-Lau-8 TaxID=1158345 RepID=UPI0004983545|nr:hypothetical protein [Persephonella sp. KM09-Lau-8]
MKIYRELLTAFAVVSVFYLFVLGMAVCLEVANLNLVNFLIGILNTAGAILLIKNKLFPLRNLFYIMLFSINITILIYLLVILIEDIDFFPFVGHKIFYTLIGSIVFLVSVLRNTNFIKNKIDI